MKTGVISVVMTVFNGAQFLRDALNSIERQNFSNLEVIVIDDGSTDDSAAIAQSYSFVSYHYQENQGTIASLNSALRKATGEFITFLDADDWWGDDKLRIQLQLLNEHPEVQIVFGYVQPVVQTPVGSPAPLLNFGSAFMRREVFDQAGLFDEQIKIYADWDWFFRAIEAGIAIHIHKDVVLYYRRHENNTTNRKQELQQALLRFLRKRTHGKRPITLTADFVGMFITNQE